MTESLSTAASASLDDAEVRRFAALAERWWDVDGPFRPLHRLNPVRLSYVRDCLCRQFGRAPREVRPLQGLRILDLGCGGGLVSEPMARLGAAVVGADPAAENVEIARHHAAEAGLAIDYLEATAEDLVARGERFDAVLSMEVVEHVPDLDSHFAACAGLLQPGRSCMVLSTLNRTLRAYALAVVGAEYVLGWLPRGTHDWNRFVRPAELEAGLRRAGLRLAHLQGVTFSPRDGGWRLSRDLAINYMAFAVR